MSFSREALQAAKARNLGHLLMRCARLYNEVGVARVREVAGLPELRPAHMQVLPHLDLDGTRQTDLARRMGMTKQAAGELIADLERMGAIERVADPSDRRARLVRLTPRAREGLLVGLGVLVAIESEVRAEVGDARVERLVDDLLVLLSVVERLGG